MSPPPLPSGFTLDQPVTPSTPPLPPGFALDGPQEGLVIDMTPSDRGAVAPAPPSKGGEKGVLDGIVGGVNTGVNWLGTRLTKAATAAAGTGRAISDVMGAAGDAAGLSPSFANALKNSNPVTLAGQFLPSSADLNKVIFDKLAPEVNTPGPLGPAVDAGTEAALSTIAMPGSVARNLLPAFLGGSSQEVAGNIPGIKGTKLEPLVRLLVGAGVGAGAGTMQNVAGNVGQGLKNIAPNVEATAAKLIGRAATNDKTTIPDIMARHGELGPGAMVVEAGGPNVRGLLRGSVTSPGVARTTAQEAFDARRGQLGDIAGSTLDRSISPNGSVSATVDELSALQRQKAGPAYEGAGVPRRPEMVAPERTIRFSMNEEPTTIPAEWNTKKMESPALTGLLKDSGVVRSAMGQIRGLSTYKNVPAGTMTMWDQVYKVLGGMEREAARGGNDRKAMLIGDERRKVLSAITEQNPRYQRALDAYSGPQRLMDAVEQGKEWFKSTVDPSEVRRQFQKMPEAEQNAIRVGVRDWARSTMDKTDRASSGVAMWSSPANRAKLEAILSPDEYAALSKQMGIVKNAAATSADVNVGSRTAPMLAEQADNLAQIQNSGLVDLLLGRPLRAGAKAIGNAAQRVTQGRTEEVNARIADYLTSTDAGKIGLVKKLAEEARLKELATQLARQNAVVSGGVLAPAIGAGNGSHR